MMRESREINCLFCNKIHLTSNNILQQIRQGSKESTASSDTDSSSDDESMQAAPTGPPEPNDKVQQAKETEAGAEISALVNYVQPVHFNSFENSESKSDTCMMKCHLCSLGRVI